MIIKLFIYLFNEVLILLIYFINFILAQKLHTN